jgi:hypothetical protein
MSVRDQIERARRAEARTRELEVEVLGVRRPAGRPHAGIGPFGQSAMAATRDIGLDAAAGQLEHGRQRAHGGGHPGHRHRCGR